MSAKEDAIALQSLKDSDGWKIVEKDLIGSMKKCYNAN